VGIPKLSRGKFVNFRGLYDLKWASRQWNLKSTRFLISQGLPQSKSACFLFAGVSSGLYAFILVYMDDLLITVYDTKGIVHIKQALYTGDTIKDQLNFLWLKV